MASIYNESPLRDCNNYCILHCLLLSMIVRSCRVTFSTHSMWPRTQDVMSEQIRSRNRLACLGSSNRGPTRDDASLLASAPVPGNHYFSPLSVLYAYSSTVGQYVLRQRLFIREQKENLNSDM